MSQSGNWELIGHWLRPTQGHLLDCANNFALVTQDELLFFDLPDGGQGTPEEPRTIHTSRLVMTSAPLRALATAPFLEAKTRTVPFQESTADFRIIRRFVYCQVIDMATVPLEFAFVADRWGLAAIFGACFELATQAFQKEKDQSIQTFVSRCFPFLLSLDVPKKFCKYFALRFALSLENISDDLKRQLFPWQFSEEGETQSGTKKRRIEQVSSRKEGEGEGGAIQSLVGRGAHVHVGSDPQDVNVTNDGSEFTVEGKVSFLVNVKEDDSGTGHSLASSNFFGRRL